MLAEISRSRAGAIHRREYAAINSAIDELIPSKRRGTVTSPSTRPGAGASAAYLTASGLVEAKLGVSAEGQNLEDIAQPLSSAGSSAQ